MARMTCTHPGCTETYAPRKSRRTTLCNAHAAGDPGRRARIAAAVRAVHQQPGETRRRSQKIAETMRERLATEPELAERYRAVGRATGLVYGGYTCDAETRARIARGNRARALAHIPLEYRDAYMELERKTDLRAAERTEIILRQVERDADEYHRTGRLPVTKGARA